MKLDLHRVVELFRKSFSTSLSDAEKEELDETLQDGCLKEVYDQLSDETFVLDKFREFEIYSYVETRIPSAIYINGYQVPASKKPVVLQPPCLH